ncbi:MAG TPA: MFS transporter [Anaerolineales bacterium]
MASETLPVAAPSIKKEFETAQVITIAGGHFVHDMYTAFVATLLPLLIEKLSLSLTMAGSLSAFLQIPGLLNPFIGYLADQVNLRYLVILAPAITATLISSMGLAPNYLSLAVLLLVAGLSSAAFHAPAPAMTAEISRRKVGLGMSLFMAGGELAGALGPLLAVWAVSTWTLSGLYRVMVPGWAATLILFLRLQKVSTRVGKSASLKEIFPVIRTVFLPIVLINLMRLFLVACLTVYLPTYMKIQGASLLVAGSSLSIVEVAAVAGALLSGTLSDRLGRKRVLFISVLVPVGVMLLFLNSAGWLQVLSLLALGFTALAATPVLLAIVQDHLPDNRSTASGLIMFTNFVLNSVAIMGVGMLGDHFGLHTAFLVSALLSLLAIPPIFLLPKAKS